MQNIMKSNASLHQQNCLMHLQLKWRQKCMVWTRLNNKTFGAIAIFVIQSWTFWLWVIHYGEWWRWYSEINEVCTFSLCWSSENSWGVSQPLWSLPPVGIFGAPAGMEWVLPQFVEPLYTLVHKCTEDCSPEICCFWFGSCLCEWWFLSYSNHPITHSTPISQDHQLSDAWKVCQIKSCYKSHVCIVKLGGQINCAEVGSRAESTTVTPANKN